MWWLFQVLIMILFIGSNGAFHWAPKGGGFAVGDIGRFCRELVIGLAQRPPALATPPARIGRYRWSKNEAARESGPASGL